MKFRRVDFEKLADACEKPEWKTDERFLTSAGLEEYKNERLEMTQAALKTRTTAEWIDRLDAHDVPHAPVLTRGEMIEHPQVKANGIIIEIDHPHAGKLRQTRPPAQFDGTPTEQRFGGARLGEHTEEVLKEAGFSDKELEAALASGAAISAA